MLRATPPVYALVNCLTIIKFRWNCRAGVGFAADTMKKRQSVNFNRESAIRGESRSLYFPRRQLLHRVATPSANAYPQSAKQNDLLSLKPPADADPSHRTRMSLVHPEPGGAPRAAPLWTPVCVLLRAHDACVACDEGGLGECRRADPLGSQVACRLPQPLAKLQRRLRLTLRTSFLASLRAISRRMRRTCTPRRFHTCIQHTAGGWGEVASSLEIMSSFPRGKTIAGPCGRGGRRRRVTVSRALRACDPRQDVYDVV
jgi:hypothetical protein